MLDKRFTVLFVFVTGMLAAAVYLSDQAVMHGGVLLTTGAAAAAAAGVLSFAVLARVVVRTERQGRAR